MHGNLVEKGQRVAALQQQLAEMKAKLQSYHSLPPSVLGARMMLKQAKERAQQMQARLDAGLADLDAPQHGTF
jgi:multidrug efflux pump subunit AcrA (membrane-fusion protein)